MRRPVVVKQNLHPSLFLGKVFLRRVKPCRYPSIRTLSERFSLGASWVFSFQPVLPPVRRPLFHRKIEVGQAIDAVTGTRLWAFAVPRITKLPPTSCALYCATVRKPLH